jgi:DNA-binding transcriptional regulator YiaG
MSTRRLRNKASQAMFAAYLNTSPSTVQKWEQGQKSPNGPSLKLLNLVDQKAGLRPAKRFSTGGCSANSR